MIKTLDNDVKTDTKAYLIEIYKQNQIIAENKKYILQTKECIINVQKAIEETVYLPPDRPIRQKPPRDVKTRYLVVESSCLDACIQIKLRDPTKSVLVLNFASGRHPGGGYKTGAIAQEESLCRASVLFNCLSSKQAQEFYQLHLDSNDKSYSNAIVFSPNVPFFRNSNHELLSDPISLHVITCAAVNQSQKRIRNANQIMRERIKRILSLASFCPRVVLGAFGCGVFRNDAGDIASIFKDLLQTQFLNVFEEVVFAVCGDEYSLEAFQFCFRKLDKHPEIRDDDTLVGEVEQTFKAVTLTPSY